MRVSEPTAPASPGQVPHLPGTDGLTVTEVRHWTDRLFSFRVTRPRSLRFRSGEFVMIGLPGDTGKLIMRAYSIASPSWDDGLEFYSIKVPDGPLTSRLQHLAVGDSILLRAKPTGTLVLDALIPGKRLFLFSTGTGIAPFASLIRDPETYEKFEEVVLTQTCRTRAALAFGEDLVRSVTEDPLIGSVAEGRLTFYPSVMRENFATTGRITDLLETGRLAADLGLPPMDAATDRAMICGSMALNNDLKALLEARGLSEGSNARPAEYVLEKAFVG